MTSRLFENVSFENSNLPSISQTTIGNGTPPFAYALGQADEWQGYLLYKGACHSVVSGGSRFADNSGDGSGTIFLHVPAFATHCQVGAVAAGTGNITIGGSYVIPIQIPATTSDPDSLSGVAPVFGPGDNDGITLGISHNGSFQTISFTVAKDDGVRLSALVFRWYRRSTTL